LRVTASFAKLSSCHDHRSGRFRGLLRSKSILGRFSAKTPCTVLHRLSILWSSVDDLRLLQAAPDMTPSWGSPGISRGGCSSTGQSRLFIRVRLWVQSPPPLPIPSKDTPTWFPVLDWDHPSPKPWCPHALSVGGVQGGAVSEIPRLHHCWCRQAGRGVSGVPWLGGQSGWIAWDDAHLAQGLRHCSRK
jgi:hypothetical protein